MSVSVCSFGVLPNGKNVEKYVIENGDIKASVITYGATLAELFVPDKTGETADVLVGFDDLEGFVERTDYQGVVVGPYANRIGGARFSIDGKEYKLVPNEKDVTCLHSCGEFNTAVWNAEIVDDCSVAFYYNSPDGLNGFPGNLAVKVVYSVTAENELKLEYSAKTDKKTFINLTNHAYFNLGGFAGGAILNHNIKINADYITPVDEFSIPTGELMSVDGTPFDFRNGAVIGDGINENNEQLVFTGGYDHNFCINGYDGTLKLASVVSEPVSGRKMEVYTDLPGVQFYAGNFLKGVKGKAGKPIDFRTGFCLETQYYPDTPNKPQFPSCLFDAGEEFASTTVFKFTK